MTPEDAAATDAVLRHFVEASFFNRRPDKIAVAVSGGGDSMALLHLAAQALPKEQVQAVTVDHGLRPESATEAAMVARFCGTLGIPHATLHWTGWDGKGNLPAMARDARYTLIAEWAKGQGIGGVMLGHTQDDLAETFLMRLGRASGVDGLAAMQTRFDRHGLTWVRPLWQPSRADLRDYLARHAIPFVDDPTNEDTTYDRPRIRAALPVLADLGITAEAISQSAHAIAAARSALDHYTSAEADRIVTIDRGDVLIPQRSQPPLPLEILRRLLLAALRWVGHEPFPPRHMAQINLDIGLMQAGKHTLAGCIITQKDHVLRITREHNAVRGLTCPTTGIWDHRWQMEGPHAPDLTIRALGEGIRNCPDWRETGLPRPSLLASPAIWRGETLIAAPLAGLQNGWAARIVADFHSSVVTH